MRIQIGRKKALAGVVGAVVLVAATYVFASTSAQATSWAPSDAEIAIADTIAHKEALGTIPSQDGSPTPENDAPKLADGAWPSNVDSVSYVEMTNADVGPLVGRDYGDDKTRTLVVRMTGSFSVETTGPRGSKPYVDGTAMTIAINPETGRMTDFALELEEDAPPLPSTAVTEYRAKAS